MKKILTILIGLILAVSLVSAVDRSPQPRPFSLFFKYNNQNVVGLDVTFKIGSQSVVKTTNRFGGVGVDLDLGYSPDFSIGRGLSDWDLYSQVLVVSCDLDLCDKEYAFKDFSTPYDETFTLSKAPPVTCDPCNCGGGGGGSCYYTEEKCNNLYPAECESTTCPPEKTCDTCEVIEPCPEKEGCVDCPIVECDEEECPEGILSQVLYAIVSFLVGGGSLYIWFGRRNKLRVRKIDGKDEVWHQHPTVSGYHPMTRIHRDHPHKKGELLPSYEKNESGAWVYTG